MDFVKNHSTESALILMTDTWLKAINEGKLVGCAMIDFRKAFDLVDHNLLLNNRPAKSPDLGRRLSAFSLHCRLSGFEVHFTG